MHPVVVALLPEAARGAGGVVATAQGHHLTVATRAQGVVEDFAAGGLELAQHVDSVPSQLPDVLRCGRLRLVGEPRRARQLDIRRREVRRIRAERVHRNDRVGRDRAAHLADDRDAAVIHGPCPVAAVLPRPVELPDRLSFRGVRSSHVRPRRQRLLRLPAWAVELPAQAVPDHIPIHRERRAAVSVAELDSLPGRHVDRICNVARYPVPVVGASGCIDPMLESGSAGLAREMVVRAEYLAVELHHGL